MTDLDVACPLLALQRAGFVRPGRRRCLGLPEPSSLSKVQSRSAGNRKAKGFVKFNMRENAAAAGRRNGARAGREPCGGGAPLHEDRRGAGRQEEVSKVRVH